MTVDSAIELIGAEREAAKQQIVLNHYTKSVPSGKSYYVRYREAIIIWSIPANKNIARFIMGGGEATVWELSRLWAPDGHDKNLLTKAISKAVAVIINKERPDALVSYADPNAGHSGGVYKAASWVYHGRSEEVRTYRSPSGVMVARRAFHSGKKSLTKKEIEALGYEEQKLPGKHRFVFPLTRKARKLILGSLKRGTPHHEHRNHTQLRKPVP